MFGGERDDDRCGSLALAVLWVRSEESDSCRGDFASVREGIGDKGEEFLFIVGRACRLEEVERDDVDGNVDTRRSQLKELQRVVGNRQFFVEKISKMLKKRKVIGSRGIFAGCEGNCATLVNSGDEGKRRFALVRLQALSD